MSSGDDWCTIESDPGVFTELLADLGCTSVQLEELWSLDDDSLTALDETGEIYGLIFLFQWQAQPDGDGTKGTNREPLTEEQIPESLFFAHQVTTNACATQAILSVVLNHGDSIELGPTLTEFKDFTASFPPSLKGVAISSSEPIKTSHNAFGRTDAFLNEGKYVARSNRSEDVYHFVAYIPKDGTVYELDGLQSGPIVVGQLSDEDKDSKTKWLSIAREAIVERMAGDAIKFNLMAVIKDKRVGLKEQIAASPNDEGLVHQLGMEEERRKQWSLENQRRRHNYVPLCVSILKELARARKLPLLVEEAKERKRQKLIMAAAAKTKKGQ